MSENKEKQKSRELEHWLLFGSMSLLSLMGFGLLYFAREVSFVALLKYSFIVIFYNWFRKNVSL